MSVKGKEHHDAHLTFQNVEEFRVPQLVNTPQSYTWLRSFRNLHVQRGVRLNLATFLSKHKPRMPQHQTKHRNQHQPATTHQSV